MTLEFPYDFNMFYSWIYEVHLLIVVEHNKKVLY